LPASCGTPAEEKLWNRLRANRLGGWHFRRQQILDGFIVDFYCHQAALVNEVDGPIHRGQVESDRRRETVLKSKGLRVIRFKNEEVASDPDSVCRRILVGLREVS
jgi:very-short-patch-repair endonuclease